MKRFLIPLLIISLLLSADSLSAQKKKKGSTSTEEVTDSLKNVSLSGLQFRSIGPAITGGRVVDIAVNPTNQSEYFVASGHGSLWKTSNRGVTFKPVFDHQKTFAIGAVEYDPSNTHVIWVGTGEHNNQNNVIYGDGVYKSEDGGASWTNKGLKNSDHIGMIAIDPTNSNVVFVAAYGSLRVPGGDRGIFKTTDGGETWKNVLHVSEYTGCYEVHMDPRNSDILYAVAHQRMRSLYTGVSGGPETAIYRSLDNGETWSKITKGLPDEDLGRIGMAVSPANPDVLYAIVEAKEEKGIYRSDNRGASWSKQSPRISAYPFYFQKLVCDPNDENVLYSLDLFNLISKDGGKTWSNLGENLKHVDNHALWIDPSDTKHLLSGCDGGVYETYDQGKNWDFKSNIPITEIYKITTDNSEPFYNVYFGTQDNNSLGGPSRTINSSGITNADWFFTNGGDGFETQVDWKNPNIIYAQSQNGGLVRFDKKSGENLYIKPYDFNDTAYRYDWDAALLISQFDNKRLYFGGNKLFRTDDQGSTWTEISPDLTRGVPQEMDQLMGRSWSIDELAWKSSMANIVTIAESPKDENKLYIGSGDGLIHFTNDGGKTWVKSNAINELPKYARIHHIIASFHDINVAYAACHDFIGGSKKPYLYKTNDGGKTWNPISNNLPEVGATYTIAEDHVDGQLLFVGTQFGLYVSNDGGKDWLAFKNGMPNTTIMDIDIQRRENDLVVSTFGRGVYILDDYSPLRNFTKDIMDEEAHIFPIKDGLMFIEANPLGYGGVGFQGASYYSAPNPEIGAVFTYYIKESFESLKEKRREIEKKAVKDNSSIPYPSYENLENEANEIEAYLLFTIKDDQGNVVRKIKKSVSKGLHRLVWNFRYSANFPINFDTFDPTIPWDVPDVGYMVVPGNYTVSLSKYEASKIEEIIAPQSFVCRTLDNTSLPAYDKKALDAFNKKVAELTRALSGVDEYRSELNNKIKYLKKAVFESTNVPLETNTQINEIEADMRAVNKILHGDHLKRNYEGAVPTSLQDRINLITYALWSTTAAPTNTYIKSYNYAAERYDSVVEDIIAIEGKIKSVEDILEKYGAQYTPGRLPFWKGVN
jgi:photosystem II stability/assembly factor-like uncharacterized protein